MVTAETAVRSGSAKLPKVAWVVLVVVSVLGVINHLLGVFAIAQDDSEALMFALFAGLNLYATAVLLRPYRRGELWAWLVTWVEVVAFAIVSPLTDPQVGAAYLVGAIIAALAQAATLPWFRSHRATTVQ